MTTEEELGKTLQDRIAELERENNAMREENNAMHEELKEAKEQIRQRSLDALRQMKISFVDRTASEPHITRDTHAPAELQRVEVALNDIKLPDAIWASAYLPPKQAEISIHSEAMVVNAVVSILEAVIAGLNLRDLVSVATNRTIAGIECDVVLLYGAQLIPFAVIEVKKPGTRTYEKIIFSSKSDTIDDAGIVAGQNFDQLCALELMGHTSLIGMITNGNKWMLTTRGKTGFPSQPVEDWENLVNEIRSYALTKHVDRSPEQDILDYFEKGVDSGCTPAERSLSVSQLVSSADGEELIKLVAIFVRLACKPLREKKMKIKLSELSCRVLNLNGESDNHKSGEMRCSFHKIRWDHIDLSKCVDFEQKVAIYLVYHLGGGENGDCCLALTQNGDKCCAVKFFVSNDGDKLTIAHAKEEIKNWEKVYSKDKDLPKCHMGILPNGGGYLCMPYLKRIPSSQRQSLIDSGAVEGALHQFSLSGYQHSDIRWRHLGFWGDKLYLLDLGDISPLQNGWVKSSLENLKKRVETQLSTPAAGSTPAHASTLSMEVSLSAIEVKSSTSTMVSNGDTTRESKRQKRGEDESGSEWRTH